MIKKILTIVLFLFYSVIFCQDSLNLKKVLFVATNVDTVAGKSNGTFLVEIIYPFKYFSDKGYEIDILTPKGGQVAIYGSVKDEMKKIQQGDLFSYKSKNSLSPANVVPGDYVAVYYPGGYGQFFDVVDNESISELTAKIYENGGVVGTAGHGAASLSNIKLSNTQYLVTGKNMTCFPWWLEISMMDVSDYGKALPFNMEAILQKRGAKLSVCQQWAKPGRCVIIDNYHRIVTGAYADNALTVAEEMVKLLQSAIIIQKTPQKAGK